MIKGLRNLITRTEHVLFDFDGPICRLYAPHGARPAAQNLVRWLAEQGADGLLTAAERDSGDTHAILRAVHRAAEVEAEAESALLDDLEARLTEEELRAAVGAYPTPYADPLIRTWHALGVPLAIATNNAPQAVEHYLSGRGLGAHFDGRIHGRIHGRGRGFARAEARAGAGAGAGRAMDGVHRLKPHPDCVLRALDSLRAEPDTALLIGDSTADCAAALEAGVPFLGYAVDERRAARLRAAGAVHIVDSLQPVLELVRGRVTY